MRENKFRGFMKGFLPFFLFSIPFIADMVKDSLEEKIREIREPVKREKKLKREEIEILEDYVPVPIPEPVEREGQEKKISIKGYATGDFSEDSDAVLLARMLFGEARGEIDTNPDYVYGVARSIINRAERSGKNINEVVLAKRRVKRGIRERDVYAYTCFDPNDDNYEKLKEPLKYESEEVWERFRDIAKKAINGNYFGNPNLKAVTNYFVGYNPEKYRTKEEARRTEIPSWAYEMKDGKFILDKQRRRIPRKPIAVVPVKITRRNPEIQARFYDLGNKF